jgi:hypothetical protein
VPSLLNIIFVGSCVVGAVKQACQIYFAVDDVPNK